MKDFTKTQKVIRVGNSYAVTLDSKFVNENELKSGDRVVGSYNKTHVAYAIPKSQPLTLRDSGDSKQSRKLTKTQKKAVLYSKITPEFSQWVDKTLDEDKEILEKLANL